MQISNICGVNHPFTWIDVFVSEMVHPFKIAPAVMHNHLPRFEKCPFDSMTHVLVIKTKNNIPIADDQLCDVIVNQYHPFTKNARSFNYELCDFYIDTETKVLHQMRNSFADYTQEYICNIKGLTVISNHFGENLMDVPIKSIPLLLLDEILTPFNIF